MIYERKNVTFRCNIDIDEGEAAAYIDRGLDKYGAKLMAVEGYVDGDDIELKYLFKPAPFDRIRRITGYLVGTLDRFNDAKLHEVEDRVKHG